jgi:hypothetical protein
MDSSSPVIKMQVNVTTKLRPVFNCSLQTGELPSLNQAAYPCIDLLTPLFKLLCLFRTNKLVILADIKKAFLQIRLKLEKDKSRFCFFWERNNKICCYRYTSIVFGLASSPFILNYVIKHHCDSYPDDVCSFV